MGMGIHYSPIDVTLILNPTPQADAEEVCTILQQAFQLVYTEATMEHLNESITAGEKGVRTSRSSVMLLPRSRGVSPPKPQSPVHSLPKPRSPVHHGATPPSFGGMPSTTGPSVPTLPEDTEGITSYILPWCNSSVNIILIRTCMFVVFFRDYRGVCIGSGTSPRVHGKGKLETIL